MTERREDSDLPNPFATLDSSRFPKRRTKESDEIKLPERDEDEEVFSRAMDALGKTRPRKKEMGFLMRDQCSIPLPKKKEAKKAALPKPDPARDEEEDIFLTAMRTAEPLKGKGREIAPKPDSSGQPSSKERDFSDLLEENLAFAVLSSDEYLEGRAVGLDEAIMNRLRQGQFSPEAHLDLHGLNAVQAFETLRDFIRDSWFKGLRAVLLVPGRGKNSPDGQGVLRRKLQSWLTQEPFKRVVLAFCTARPVDGGPGSVYVLLRKFKKKGPVYWERMPADADLY